MDWLEDFKRRFDSYEVGTLKQRKFHGALTINFADGISHTSELKQHFKAKENQPKPQEVR